MVHKKRIQNVWKLNLRKAREARASQSYNAPGTPHSSSPSFDLCWLLRSRKIRVAILGLFSPLFCNIVICAYPLPPVFGRFFAIPASFVAAIGLPLRLFVPQAAEKSRPRHPRAPRRRISSRMVRNLKKIRGKCDLGFQVHQQPRYASSLITFQ